MSRMNENPKEGTKDNQKSSEETGKVASSKTGDGGWSTVRWTAETPKVCGESFPSKATYLS